MAGVTIDGVDGSIVTGYNTPVVRLTTLGLWLLLVIHILLTGAGYEHPWIWITFATGLYGALLLTKPGEQLSAGDSVILTSCGVVTSLVLFAYQDPSDNIWMYVFASYLVAVQAARGNLVGALMGAGLVCLIGASWAWFYGADAIGYFAVLALPVLNAAAFTSLNLVIRRYVARAREHRSAAARSAEAKAAAAAALKSGRHELAEVRREAEGLLRKLSEGDALDAQARAEIATAEATIRDRIRSPRLQHPLLNATIRGVRRRGGAVLLLGEAEGEATPPLSDALAVVVCERIGELGDGARITIRALPAHAAAELTLLVSESGRTSRVSLAADGSVIGRS